MSKVYPKFEKNPIVEAVFCVDLTGLPHFSETTVKAVMHEVDSSYEKESDQISQSLTFDLTSSAKAIVPDRFWQGMSFRKGNYRILLSNLDQQVVRFGFSQLKPYESWQAFIVEARKLYDAFLKAMKRDPYVKRIGIRFVNVLNIPNGQHQLGELLRNVPSDPADMENIHVEDFLYKETSYYGDFDLKATVIRTVQHQHEGNPVFVFDDDIFSNPDTESSKMNWDELLDRVHDLKNSIFFGSVSADCLNKAAEK